MEAGGEGIDASRGGSKASGIGAGAAGLIYGKEPANHRGALSRLIKMLGGQVGRKMVLCRAACSVSLTWSCLLTFASLFIHACVHWQTCRVVLSSALLCKLDFYAGNGRQKGNLTPLRTFLAKQQSLAHARSYNHKHTQIYMHIHT